MYKTLLVICITLHLQLSTCKNNQEWAGRWFPDSEPYISHSNGQHIQMGIIENCDDGKTNLEVDYDGSPTAYTCYDDRMIYLPNPEVSPVLAKAHIPKAFKAPHYCMNETITYKEAIPTFGGHRPVWPKYGEYSYLPPQRWLHSLEHGAIVLLYHPCANYNEVQQLKNIVRNCLYRHVITPYSMLTYERPIALIAWGNRLLMSKVDPVIAIKFITTFGNHGPEKTPKNGDYSFGLLSDAKMVSNQKDNIMCPSFVNM